MKKFFYGLSVGLMAIACILTVGYFSESVVTLEDAAAVDYGSCDEHIYPAEYTEVSPATCSAEGVKWRKCVVCGDIEYVKTPKDPDVHSRVSSMWTYDPKPNCTEGGMMFHVCYGCNKATDITELPPDPEAHVKRGDYVTVTPATCSSKGEKAYRCAVCGEYFGFQVIDVNPESHVMSDESEWEVTKVPGCAEDGEMVCYCDDCGEVALTKTIPATQKHIPGDELIVDVLPTCSADGSESYHCTVCGASVGARIIPSAPDAHTFAEEFTIDTETTCSSEGSKSRHCIYCDKVTDITVIPIDKNAHVYDGDWIVTREPTCSLYGLMHKVCSLCGEQSHSTMIEKAAHTYGDYEIIKYSADKLSAQVRYTCQVCGYEYIDIVVFGTNDDPNIGADTDVPIYKLVPTADTVILVDSEAMIVSNVAKNISIGEFYTNFKNGSNFVVYNISNRILNEDDIIATGYRLNYEDVEGWVTNYRVSVTGDVNSDGAITSADARMILRSSAGLENLKNEFFLAADVNGDGKISASDARKALRVAANMELIESTLPPIPGLDF